MKKILLNTVILSALATSTLASVPSPVFSGFYLGAGLTYSKGNLNLSPPSGNSVKFHSSGVGGNGFIGYGAPVYGGLYLGGELGFGFDGSNFNKTYTSGNNQVFFKSKSKFVYNIVGRIGYIFSNFLAYAKGGFEGRSKVTGSDNFGNSVSIGRNGWVLGVGGDYALTKNVFLRAEYSYNFGKRSSIDNVTVRTPTQTGLVGAAYKF